MPPTPAGPKTQAEKDRDARLAPLVASIKAGKSLLTRRINQAEQKCHAFTNVAASNAAITEMGNLRQLVRDAAKRVEDAYMKISTADDPAQFEEYMKRLEAEVDRAEKTSDLITDHVIVMEQELRANEETASNNGGNGTSSPNTRVKAGDRIAGPPEKTTVSRKPNDALKPFTLTSAHTPVELEEWMGRFRAYHSTSQMNLCSATDQQAYLRSCMDAALYNRVKCHFTDTMPIFVEDGNPALSCFALLRREFNKHFPVVTRRVAFFKQDQKAGESFSDWARAVQETAAQCQFDAVTKDDLVMLRLLTGVADKKLALDLYKIQNPTLEKLNEAANAYEVAKRTFAAVVNHKEKPGAFQASAGGSGSGKTKKGKAGHLANANNANSSQTKSYKCYRCGDLNKDHSCKATSATCKYCGKTGHFASVCNKKKADGKAGGNNKPPKGKKTPAGANSADADGESDEEQAAAHAGTTE